jgi:hypothetical protein
MYCIARQCILPVRSREQAEDLLTEAALHSLAELFEAVPGPRAAHGLRYDLPFLLACLVVALLCNCDGTEAVAQWCRDHSALLRRVFGPRLFLIPSGSLYRWLLPQLDACAIERVLGSWVQATATDPADEPLALDGKTLQGARSGEQAAPHLLASLPRTYGEETLLLIGLLRTLWRLSYQDMHDWLKQWPALALACGLPLGKDGTPRIPSPSQQCKRRRAAGAPLHESLFVLTVFHAMRRRLIGARDLIIDSVPILAWRRRDPDAADLACSRSASTPLVIGLSGAYLALSRFRASHLLPAFSCQCP